MLEYEIETIQDCTMLDEKLKNSIVKEISITVDDTQLQIDFTDGSQLHVKGDMIESIGVNAELKVEFWENA